jgi:hypothetical protein
MGKHSKDNVPETNDKNYDAQHKGNWDGYDWALYSSANDQTQIIPAQNDKKRGK